MHLYCTHESKYRSSAHMRIYIDKIPLLWYNRGIETKHRQESEMEATNNTNITISRTHDYYGSNGIEKVTVSITFEIVDPTLDRPSALRVIAVDGEPTHVQNVASGADYRKAMKIAREMLGI